MIEQPRASEEASEAEVGRMLGATAHERAALDELTRAVHPPERAASWPGRSVEWSSPEWGARIWRGERLASFAGLYVREARLDGGPIRIGGVGNVKTHPDERRRGHAGRLLGKAAEFFREQGVAFGVLFCEPRLIGYYGALGWRAFEGQVLVTQRGERVEFTFNGAMTLGVSGEGPTAGCLDLCGPPW